MRDPTHFALIDSLSSDLQPVRRLPGPWVRAASWLLVCGAAAAGLMAIHGSGTITDKLASGQDAVFEFAAAVATAVTAALAAFMLSVPGRSVLWALLPIPLLTMWICASGIDCWLADATSAVPRVVPMSCFKFIVLSSLPLSLLLLVMLRRAFSVRPNLTATMAGLAAAAAAAVLLDLQHPIDASLDDLLAHAAAILVVIGANRLLSARALGVGLLVLSLSHGAAAAARRPVVVELFTSQGCSSCPPADEILNDFARNRKDLLPLSFHVEYWNRLGWVDPYSSPEATERQRVYAAHSADPTLFTPEMVIDGSAAVVGSDPDSIQTVLDTALDDAVTLANVSVKAAGGEVLVTVGAGTGQADVVLVGYDRLHVTPVGRGENGGRKLTESNIVRSIQSIGAWTGSPLSLRQKLPAGQLMAVLLAAPDGRIVGAAVAGR
jgi:hypothetical protein